MIVGHTQYDTPQVFWQVVSSHVGRQVETQVTHVGSRHVSHVNPIVSPLKGVAPQH